MPLLVQQQCLHKGIATPFLFFIILCSLYCSSSDASFAASSRKGTRHQHHQQQRSVSVSAFKEKHNQRQRRGTKTVFLYRNPPLQHQQNQQQSTWTTMMMMPHFESSSTSTTGGDCDAPSDATQPSTNTTTTTTSTTTMKNQKLQEAQDLKRKAKELLAEARLMERNLISTRSKKQKNVAMEQDLLIQRLFETDILLPVDTATAADNIIFHQNDTTDTNGTIHDTKKTKASETTTSSMMKMMLVEKLRDRRHWSAEKLISVVERLHQRLRQSMGKTKTSTATTAFQIADTSNGLETNVEEFNRVSLYLSLLLDAARAFDTEDATNATTATRSTELLSNNQTSTARTAPKTTASREQSFRGETSTSSLSLVTLLEAKLRALERDPKTAATSQLDKSFSQSDDDEASLVNQYTSQTLGTTTTSDASTAKEQQSFTSDLEAILLVERSPWLPPSFATYLRDPKFSGTSTTTTLDPQDVTMIRNQILADSEFDCSSVQSNAKSACFGGTVPKQRSSDNQNGPTVTTRIFDDIQRRMKESTLSDRVQLFLQPDTRPVMQGQHHREGMSILAFPKTALQPSVEEEYSLASVASCAGALLTTFGYAVACCALNPSFYAATVMTKDTITPLAVLLPCAPIFLGIVAIQGIHELSHRWMARRHHVTLGLPVPLASPPLGLFGATTLYKTFPPTSSSALDIALAGPLSGMVTSTLCVVGGLYATVGAASASVLSTFPVVPVVYLKSSLVVSAILHLVAPKLLLLPLAQPIPVHPAVLIGTAGLVTNALNMLPIIGLDGGHALSAILGRKPSVLASAGTFILFLLALLRPNASNNILLWFMMVLLFSPISISHMTKPLLVRNAMTPVTESRLWAYATTFLFAIVSLIPYPGGHGVF